MLVEGIINFIAFAPLGFIIIIIIVVVIIISKEMYTHGESQYSATWSHPAFDFPFVLLGQRGFLTQVCFATD